MFPAKHLFAAVLLCACAQEVQSAQKHWFQVRSAHFTVVTDLSEKRGIEVAQRCEQMRAAFALLMNRASTHDPAPLLIFALNGQKEVDELGSERNLKSRHMGLFLAGPDQNFMLVDASGDPWHAVFHEYAHELLNANTPSAMQTWFDEGFAEYFSTLELGVRATRLGMVPFAELQFLREDGKLMRFADLAAVRQDSLVYNQSGRAQAMFYAESWLLVHYLFDHQLISQAEPFFKRIADGSTLEQATKAAFGMSPAHLESELMEYAKGDRFRYFSLPAVENLAIMQVTTVGLSPVTARALLAGLGWHARSRHSKSDAEAYTAESRALLALEPQNSTALRGLGIALMELDRYADALDVLRAAVQMQPNEVLNHYVLAVALSGKESGKNPGLPAGISLEQELVSCMKLDPDFADVYRLKAAELSRSGLLDAAAETMHKAILLSPRSESYELTLAGIELKKRDYAPALALLQELKNSHNPDISKQAEYFLSSEVAQPQAGEQ